jgi:hypothetical protein
MTEQGGMFMAIGLMVEDGTAEEEKAKNYGYELAIGSWNRRLRLCGETPQRTRGTRVLPRSGIARKWTHAAKAGSYFST